jgi:hypothetical protein
MSVHMPQKRRKMQRMKTALPAILREEILQIAATYTAGQPTNVEPSRPSPVTLPLFVAASTTPVTNLSVSPHPSCPVCTHTHTQTNKPLCASLCIFLYLCLCASEDLRVYLCRSLATNRNPFYFPLERVSVKSKFLPEDELKLNFVKK